MKNGKIKFYQLTLKIGFHGGHRIGLVYQISARNILLSGE
jgi:hypothetical protein